MGQPRQPNGHVLAGKQLLADSPDILIFKKRHWGQDFYSLEEPHLVGYPNFDQSTLDESLDTMPRQPIFDISYRPHHIVTTAPFEGVKAATVFTPTDERFCRGILLTYKNGGQRSLGECLLGYDDSVTVEDPLFIEILSHGWSWGGHDNVTGETVESTSAQNMVVFHNTFSKQKEGLDLQRMGKKYLRWHEIRLHYTKAEVVEEDN